MMRIKWAVVALGAVAWAGLVQAEPPPAANRGRAVKGAGAERSPAAAGSAGAARAGKPSEAARAARAGKPSEAAFEPSEASKRSPRARSPRGSLDTRVEKLKQRAAELRAEGQAQQASRLEKQAELLANHPRTGRAHGTQTPKLRKRARIKRWHGRYGAALQRPDVQAELRHHGLRLAKLRRMKELAQQRPDSQQRDALLQRIDALRARENARHGRRMERLTTAAASPAEEGTP